MNAEQLIVKLTQSADEHDEGTGEDNRDITFVLARALKHLESVHALDDFIEELGMSDLREVLEFEWLKPTISYVRIPNKAETAKLFYDLRALGFHLAAESVQNPGTVLRLDEMNRAKESITDPDLQERFNELIDAGFIPGKDAD